MRISSNPIVVNRLLWLILLALGLVDLAWLFHERMTLDLSHIYPLVFIYAMFIAISLFYRIIRKDETIFLFGQIAAQWLTAAAVIGIMSYVSARTAFPLLDESLIAADRALGFDWKTYVEWVDTNPLLAKIYSAAYLSSGPQILIMSVVLFFYKRADHIQRFLLAFILTGVATTLLAMLFPAVGGYVYYDINVANYSHLEPIASRIHEAPLLSMRNHTTDVIAFPMQGLVTFPSFHSALSVLLIYISWPVWWLRGIALPLNLLVLASTPVDGGHYLSDVIGGVAITLVAIALVRKRA